MLIRDATPEEWPAIWRVLREAIVAGETLTADPGATPERIRAGWMDKRGGRVFVAVDGDGTIVGSADVYPNHGGPGSHVANAGFVVDASHRGKGIGRALAEHVLEEARRDGYQAMQFNAVVESNTRAVRLWRALGFEILATVPEAFRHPRLGPVGLHIMYRRL
jgi:GNAT superfamily N-acetyltransferase